MERRDLYDKNKNLTGETILKGEAIPDERYIVVVLVFIQNSEGNFLIQKRSERKNDSIEGIITEVKEEIGLDINPANLQLYFSGKSEKAKVLL